LAYLILVSYYFGTQQNQQGLNILMDTSILQQDGGREGYCTAYMYGGSDNVAFAMFDGRSAAPGFVPVSYNVLEDSATTLRVDVRTATDDGMLRLDQGFYMPKDENYVQITMTLTNIGTETLTDVVLKRCVDLDTDTGGANGWAGFDNIFDIDYTRNIVYAYTNETYPYDPRPPGAESHYVGIASCPTADYYDVDDWNDYYQRDSPVDFTLYPVFGDYMATQQWNFGTMNPGESKTVSVIYSVGYTLSDLHGCAPTAVPELTPSGLIALVGLLSVVLAMSVRTRKKKR
jgi:hypothetical protein